MMPEQPPPYELICDNEGFTLLSHGSSYARLAWSELRDVVLFWDYDTHRRINLRFADHTGHVFYLQNHIDGFEAFCGAMDKKFPGAQAITTSYKWGKADSLLVRLALGQAAIAEKYTADKSTTRQVPPKPSFTRASGISLGLLAAAGLAAWMAHEALPTTTFPPFLLGKVAKAAMEDLFWLLAPIAILPLVKLDLYRNVPDSFGWEEQTQQLEIKNSRWYLYWLGIAVLLGTVGQSFLTFGVIALFGEGLFLLLFLGAAFLQHRWEYE
jgi:hypothetical protein